MTIKTLEKTLKKLSKEVLTLRSFIIESSQPTDEEGQYKPSFVKKALTAQKYKADIEYSGRGSLLQQIREI